MIPPSTPIIETMIVLNLAFDAPAHVRTAGDLLVALKRGDIDVPVATAKKIKESIA